MKGSEERAGAAAIAPRPVPGTRVISAALGHTLRCGDCGHDFGGRVTDADMTAHNHDGRVCVKLVVARPL